MVASRSATAPKIENIHPNKRSAQKLIRRFSSPVRTLKSGTNGSDFRNSSLTADVIEAGGTPSATRIVNPVFGVAMYG